MILRWLSLCVVLRFATVAYLSMSSLLTVHDEVPIKYVVLKNNRLMKRLHKTCFLLCHFLHIICLDYRGTYFCMLFY